MSEVCLCHIVLRTSPKGPGSPFVGRCALCGEENLSASAALLECLNPNKVTADEAVIRAILGDDNAVS